MYKKILTLLIFNLFLIIPNTFINCNEEKPYSNNGEVIDIDVLLIFNRELNIFINSCSIGDIGPELSVLIE